MGFSRCGDDAVAECGFRAGAVDEMECVDRIIRFARETTRRRFRRLHESHRSWIRAEEFLRSRGLITTLRRRRRPQRLQHFEELGAGAGGEVGRRVGDDVGVGVGAKVEAEGETAGLGAGVGVWDLGEAG